MRSAKPHYSRINIIIQKISSTRPASWFFARNLHHIDEFFLRLSKGRITLTNFLSGLQVVILTTTGARSGLPRTTPLACIKDPDNPNRFAVIASNLGGPHHPAWYYNLKANPRATIAIDHQVRTYLAHEAMDEDYARFWEYGTQIYPGYQFYQQRVDNRRIPIMVMTLEESSVLIKGKNESQGCSLE